MRVDGSRYRAAIYLNSKINEAHKFQGRILDEPLTFKHFYSILLKCHAGMAELADAHGSGPCEYYFRGGSSPLACTNEKR